MTYDREWVPSADMARVLGIHPQTLRKLRRSQINLFKQGRDYCAEMYGMGQIERLKIKGKGRPHHRYYRP